MESCWQAQWSWHGLVSPQTRNRLSRISPNCVVVLDLRQPQLCRISRLLNPHKHFIIGFCTLTKYSSKNKVLSWSWFGFLTWNPLKSIIFDIDIFTDWHSKTYKPWFYSFFFFLCSLVWGEHQLGWLFALSEAAVLKGQSPVQQSDAERHEGVFLDHQLPLLHQAHAKW